MLRTLGYLETFCFRHILNAMHNIWADSSILYSRLFWAYCVSGIFSHISQRTLQKKKWSFSFRISLVNVTKSDVFSRFSQIYWRDPQWKTSFFVQWYWAIFAHIRVCFGRFMHFQNPCITGPNSVNQNLLFKPGFSFKSLFKSIWNTFSFMF